MIGAGQFHSNAFFSDMPEREYAAKINTENIKRLGQFFTPFPIARFMVNWVISNPYCKTILDPAVGLGIFFRIILNEHFKNAYKLIGYDVDPQVLKRAISLFREYDQYDINLINCDYLINDWNNKYDGVICNPPYQRFQNYKNRTEILSEFQNHLGLSLSGLTNMHTLFLIKSINQLSPDGRAAFILPSEFLNADYGVFIKRELIKDKSLKYVIVFDSNENLFDNVITTSCILLFDNSIDKNTVEFISVKSLNELSSLEEQFTLYPYHTTNGKAVFYKELDENIKWRAYYQKQNGNK